ncbi:protein kinase protein with tetratricopeptiderepeat domain [Striga asiatica]|uniref:Protein kinase protein with tetratricopeptiderepeat domain n=1 Tax=Striga asiatica TaxID=4170 RepID=A0A5A7QMD7_STRAF|nr:protein kinase protein with tetratricopeptiderepeat domain [Striga asiatica]
MKLPKCKTIIGPRSKSFSHADACKQVEQPKLLRLYPFLGNLILYNTACEGGERLILSEKTSTVLRSKSWQHHPENLTHFMKYAKSFQVTYWIQNAPYRSKYIHRVHKSPFGFQRSLAKKPKANFEARHSHIPSFHTLPNSITTLDNGVKNGDLKMLHGHHKPSHGKE